MTDEERDLLLGALGVLALVTLIIVLGFVL